MRAQRVFRRGIVLQVVGLIGLSLAGSAGATTFNWTKPNGCGFFSCDFFDASAWSPGTGPPSTGDVAFIDMDGTTHLTQNTAGLAGLTLEGSTAFRTSGHRLSITENPGNLFMFGLGTTGSTSLRVDQGSGFEVIAKTISLHQGSQINLQGGGVTATFRVLVSQSSLISGHGTVGLVGNEIGSAIEVAGTIRPSGGDITLISTNSLHDLDGNIAGVEPGFLDLTSTGSLVVNGEQNDPFSGQLDIGNGRSLTLDSLWEMDGALNFTTVNANRLIAPQLSFLSGSQVQTSNSEGRIEGESSWQAGAAVSLRTTDDRLWLLEDSVVESGALFTGAGQLINASGSTMVLEDAASVGVRLLNQGTLKLGDADLSDSIAAATVENYIQQAGGTLDIQLNGTDDGEFDTMHVLETAQLIGELAISTPIGFSLTEGQRFKILEVDGNTLGEFEGLSEGALIGSFGEELFITYAGGDGNDVVLYTAGQPGDFDQDGDVDGTDFLVWQRNPNVGQLSDWQSNYGATAPIASSVAIVPEPAASSMFIGVVLSFVARKHMH